MRKEYEEMYDVIKNQLDNMPLKEIEEHLNGKYSVNDLERIFDYSVRTANMLQHKVRWIKPSCSSQYNRLFFSVEEKINYLLYYSNIGVEYMDVPLNKGNYIAQAFYREIYERYQNSEMNRSIVGLYDSWNTTYGRKIKLEYLTSEEQEKAYKITLYLRILAIRNGMEQILDCLNYIQD